MPSSLALTGYADNNSQGGSHTETERERERQVGKEKERKRGLKLIVLLSLCPWVHDRLNKHVHSSMRKKNKTLS